MLQLLRKYQKGVFAVVTVFVIASFMFFGTQRAIFQTKAAEPDQVIGKAIDGSDMKMRELKALTKLIEGGDDESSPNLFNDRVVQKDILEAGLGLLLMKEYRISIEPELRERFVKFQKYRPYTHPQKFISAEAAWKMFMPELYEAYQNVQNIKEPFSDEAIDTLIALYLRQNEFPSGVLRRILKYQEQQYSQWVRPDPYLDSGDLHLFHAKSLSDWFGPKFVEIVAQFIYNSAAFAKEQGYQVSYEEARSSLLQVGLKKLMQADPNRQVTSDALSRAFHHQLAAFGLSEQEVVGVWQKVILFRKLFQDVGTSLFIDSLTAKDLFEKGAQKVALDIYTLPPQMQIDSVKKALLLEIYLNEIGKERKLGYVPEVFYTPKELYGKRSKLVQKRFLIEMAEVKKQEVATDISLKQMYQWQVEESHWSDLQKKFPMLAKCGESDSERRFAFLSRLDEKVREEIDSFSRTLILEENPSLIRERLAGINENIRVVTIGNNDHTEVLPGIENHAKLLDLLDEGAVEAKDERSSVQTSLEKLSCYTQDNEHFYRIRVLDSSGWEGVTFAEAAQNGFLEEKLDRRLRAVYQAKERKLGFDEMRETLMEEILNTYLEQRNLSHLSGKIAYYFSIYHHLEKLQKSVEAGKDEIFAKRHVRDYEDRSLIKRPLFNNQFKLVKENAEIAYDDSHPLRQENLFETEEKSWFALQYVNSYGPCFFQLIEKQEDQEYIAAKMRKERFLLGKEAKQALMKRLIQEITIKEALHIASTEDNGS